MKEETYPFVMRPLPYEYFGLAPKLSAQILMYHHDKHYRTYVAELNQCLADDPLAQKQSLTQLLESPENLPKAMQESLRKYGGGVYLHELYFDGMQSGESEDPRGALLEKIQDQFGSVKALKDGIREQAGKLFGSGYVLLVLDQYDRLRIVTTKDQELPDIKENVLILALDLWEHAYYLQYQNRRHEYVEAWLSMINWRKAAVRYEEGRAKMREIVQQRGFLPHPEPPEAWETDFSAESESRGGTAFSAESESLGEADSRQDIGDPDGVWRV